MTDTDYPFVATLRDSGLTWAEVAERIGHGDHANLRKAYHRWRNRQPYSSTDEDFAVPGGGERHESTTVSGRKFRDVRTMDDLVAFFDVDLDVWEPTGLRVGGSEWDQSVEKGTVAQSVRLNATFTRRADADYAEARASIARCLEEVREHAPRYEAVPRPRDLGQSGDAVLCELSLNDAHLGMRAWGSELSTGVDYDLDIAESGYVRAGEHLLSLAHLYNVRHILVVLGHDFGHVNQYAEKTLTTRGGTPQDVDGRLAKIFTALRRASVAVLDTARLIAPVTAVVVPGNHDPDEMYKLGEVLSAWYRHDPEVEVQYSPERRQWYGWGRNAFMLTHGEEYDRKRDNLPMIMATECPAELWVASEGGVREVHTGHNHIRKQGKYVPTGDVDESRAIVTRSLPGLTATDAWHDQQGYRHRRAGTAMFWYREGGLAGLHEYQPREDT